MVVSTPKREIVRLNSTRDHSLLFYFLNFIRNIYGFFLEKSSWFSQVIYLNFARRLLMHSRNIASENWAHQLPLNSQEHSRIFRTACVCFFFQKKVCKVATLTRFFFVFQSKTPIFGRISEVSFDGKCIKIIDILIFMMENRTVFAVFLLNHPIQEKTELK